MKVMDRDKHGINIHPMLFNSSFMTCNQTHCLCLSYLYEFLMKSDRGSETVCSLRQSSDMPLLLNAFYTNRAATT